MSICKRRQQGSKARLRWKLLSTCIRNRSLQYNHLFSDVSVREFTGYHLFETEDIESDDCGKWCQLSLKTGLGDHALSTKSSSKYDGVVIRTLHPRVKLSVLIGFNNTGNVCIWPSEEVLGYYCLQNRDMFKGKRICELGSGMTALAGILLARNVDAELVYLSDGNQASVDNIHDIINRNSSSFRAKMVEASQLVWNEGSDSNHLQGSFDFIICADCLFFKDVHQGLIQVMKNILKKEGIVIMFAPNRGDTLDCFRRLASTSFQVTVSKEYDRVINSMHLKFLENSSYDPDIHFPVMISMKVKDS